MVGKDPGVRDDSILLKISPFFPLAGMGWSISYTHVLFSRAFFSCFLPFFAYIWRFLDEPVFIDPAASSSFLQPSIKAGFTLSEGLPQDFLLVEAK